jgi:hypothetical protein
MHISFKIIKFISLYVAQHVSDTTVPIIRSFPLLNMQPLVTVWCSFGCVLQPCLRSNNRTGLEDATETTPHGDQRLHVQ